MQDGGDKMPTSRIDLDVIARRIDERAKALGLSMREASLKAGLNKGYVREVVTGRSKAPDLQKLAAIAEALDCDVAYLVGAQELPRTPDAPTAPPSTPPATPGSSPRLIPVYRSCTIDGPIEPFEPVDQIECPWPLIRVPGAYAVVVVDDVMAPRYFAGEVCFVHPGLPVRQGDFVVVRRADGALGPRQFVGIDAEGVTLKRTGTAEVVTYPRAEIVAMHRITGSGSLA